MAPAAAPSRESTMIEEREQKKARSKPLAIWQQNCSIVNRER
jgi:hypothetical protein